MPKRPISLAPIRALIERQPAVSADVPRGARANQTERDAAARQRIFNALQVVHGEDIAQEWASRHLAPKR